MSNKVTIQGAPPAWSDEEYLHRLDAEINMYNLTAASLEMVRAPLEHAFLNLVIEKAQSGYTISTRYPVVHEVLSHTVMMDKPDGMRAADIDALKAKVKDEYVEWLQAEHVRYQGLLREQLLQTAADKERQQREKEEAKKLDAINKQIEECYTPLDIPDGVPHRKPAVFSTEM